MGAILNARGAKSHPVSPLPLKNGGWRSWRCSDSNYGPFAEYAWLNLLPAQWLKQQIAGVQMVEIWQRRYPVPGVILWHSKIK
ncbi:hypothetical protein ACMGEE_12585 [Erwinia sp. DT-104]|uniref:hypothetical protein n=1 Tax=Erwinia sp. DT-104 TaxID=3396161 RepID=UPI003F1A2699